MNNNDPKKIIFDLHFILYGYILSYIFDPNKKGELNKYLKWYGLSKKKRNKYKKSYKKLYKYREFMINRYNINYNNDIHHISKINNWDIPKYLSKNKRKKIPICIII